MNLRALTEKQLMIAQRLSDGLTVEEIAAERHRSVQTIRKHVEQARDRLGARNLAHLVALTLGHDSLIFGVLYAAALLSRC
jgi:DNA-binding NarL/FixJ family response regulator